MDMKRSLVITLASAAAFAGLAGAANASIVVGGSSYVPVGPTETVSAAFTQPNGGSTAGAYNGLVQLTVVGTGQSLGACFNDAFYVYDCGLFNDGTYYQLTVDNAALVSLNPAQDAIRFIVYDLNSGSEVTSRPYAPAYSATNTYSFVVDMALMGAGSPGPLFFGVSDGNFADNSGAYRIQVTQLAAVPEPGSVALVGAGLGLAAWMRRRQRQA